jgi:hypothetical protein
MQSRMDEAVLESFEPRPPIPLLSKTPLTSLKEALEHLPLEGKEELLQYAEFYFPDGAACEGSPALNGDEARTVYVYTCDMEDPKLFEVLNASLRDKDRSKLTPYLKYAKLMLSATGKLLRRCDRILWRGVKADLFDMYKDKLNGKVVFWGFTSTTTDMAVIENFLPANGGTIFCIQAEFAASIQKFSAFSHESEMLLPAGTIFEVRNVYKRSGTTFIELKTVGNMLGVKPSTPPAVSVSISDLE